MAPHPRELSRPQLSFLSLTVFALAQSGQLQGYLWTNPNATFSFSSAHRGTELGKLRPVKPEARKTDTDASLRRREGMSATHAVVAEKTALERRHWVGAWIRDFAVPLPR